MSDDTPTLVCPACESANVATASEQLFMVNGDGGFYCESVKPHDSDARAVCLDCHWEGRRQNLRASPTAPTGSAG